MQPENRPRQWSSDDGPSVKEENEKLDTVAVIFARGGSRYLREKLERFCWKTIGWAIEQTIPQVSRDVYWCRPMMNR